MKRLFFLISNIIITSLTLFSQSYGNLWYDNEYSQKYENEMMTWMPQVNLPHGVIAASFTDRGPYKKGIIVNTSEQVILPLNYNWDKEHEIYPTITIFAVDSIYWTSQKKIDKVITIDFCFEKTDGSELILTKGFYIQLLNDKKHPPKYWRQFNAFYMNPKDGSKDGKCGWLSLSYGDMEYFPPFSHVDIQSQKNYNISFDNNNRLNFWGTYKSGVKRLKEIRLNGFDHLGVIIHARIYRPNLRGKMKPLIDNAAREFANKNFESAMRLYTQIIEDNKYETSEIYCQRAQCYYNLGYYRSAIIDWNSAIALTSDTKLKESLNYQIGRLKFELEDPTFAENLRLGGHDGRILLQELNLGNNNVSTTTVVSNNDSILSETARGQIKISDHSVKLTASEIYNKCNPAVFTIYTKDAQGSGFFIGDDGLAISNYHVFEGSNPSDVMALLPNGGLFQIKEILGYSKNKDFVVFRVAGSGFSYIPISQKEYKIGETVYAIGSPKGEKNTLSTGVISGDGHSETTFKISVPIDHGSSGGVLLNEYGEAIGITSGGRDDTHANLNYAIDIKKVLNK